MPFRLWPRQVEVLWSLMQHRLVIVLKARQLGISWLCCWYALWLCLWQPGKVVLLFSKGQQEANELARRVLVLYRRLPDWMKEEGPRLVKDNTGLIEWANGSRVKSLPATESAGRSFTASLVILDEAAFLQWAEPLYTALKPTIDGGGQLVVLSTANGLGNLFHRLWTKAVAGHNDYRPIFLPWMARPGRDAAWYARQLAEYTDPEMVKQEYPASANEAFITSGRPRFHPEWIAAQAAYLRAPLATHALPLEIQDVPGLAVYTLPPVGRCIVGADVAEGGEQGDYSAAVVIEAGSLTEVASLHGHFEPDLFAVYLDRLAAAYRAELVVERNNHGHAVLSKLRQLRGTHKVHQGQDGKYGWLTNAQTKPVAIDGLAALLRDGLMVIRSQATLDELQIYQVLNDGKTGGPPGYHDDRVMALAIATAVASRPSAVATGTHVGLWKR